VSAQATRQHEHVAFGVLDHDAADLAAGEVVTAKERGLGGGGWT
jgi:hypothetical protein